MVSFTTDGTITALNNKSLGGCYSAVELDGVYHNFYVFTSQISHKSTYYHKTYNTEDWKQIKSTTITNEQTPRALCTNGMDVYGCFVNDPDGDNPTIVFGKMDINDNTHTTHLFAGINEEQSQYTLQPREVFTTPVFAFTFSDEGKSGVSRNIHRWARLHRLNHGTELRDVLLNSWEGVYFKVNQEGMDRMMADLADLGGDSGQKPRLPGGVGVQQGDVFARRLCDAAVACGADPGVGLPDEPYERRADRTHDLRAAVGRTVVHDDDLLRGAGLRQGRAYGRADFQLLVVEGYDDRNGGF